MNTKKRD